MKLTLKKTIASILCISMIPSMMTGCKKESTSYSHTDFAMGTVTNITLYGTSDDLEQTEQKIIDMEKKLEKQHSTETKSSTSLPTISGTVTEIGNGYIMVDDTVLCKKSKAGKKYKVYTDDIKIRRWIESGELKEGDLVVVEYEGEISSNYEVKGAYSIFTGTLEENGILNQE